MTFEETIADVVRRDSVRVPPYPSTAMQLQQVMRRPDWAMPELVNAMRADAVFTGNILRLANSPFYRRDDEVTALQTAVARIGSKELTRLALAASLSVQAAAPGALRVWRRGVWRQALTSALVCEALGSAFAVDPGEAFVAGLLHDAGKLLVLGCLEDALGKGHGDAAADVGALLERHHVALGLMLAKKWQLPAGLVKAIADHHQSHGSHDALTRVAAVSDRVVALLEENAVVSPKALEPVTGLSGERCEALAAKLPGIPATIATFEAGPSGPADAARTASLPVRPEGPAGLWLEVQTASKGAPHRLEVVTALEHSVTARSSVSLEVNQLIEVQVADRPVRAWAVVREVSPGAGGFEVRFSFFAASSDVGRLWQQLIEGQAARAA